jgi:hypothetical protein
MTSLIILRSRILFKESTLILSFSLWETASGILSIVFAFSNRKQFEQADDNDICAQVLLIVLEAMKTKMQRIKI